MIRQALTLFLCVSVWGQEIIVSRPAKKTTSPPAKTYVKQDKGPSPSVNGSAPPSAQGSMSAPNALSLKTSQNTPFPTHFFGISRETFGERKSWVYEAELREQKVSPKDIQSYLAAAKLPAALASHLTVYAMYGRKGVVAKGAFQDYHFYVVHGPGFLKGAYVPTVWGFSRNTFSEAEWVDPELKNGAWIFPTPKLTVKLIPTLSEFHPRVFQSIILSNAKAVKYKINGDYTVFPYSLDGVLCLSDDGMNRYQGLFKFPLWPVVVPLQGVKVDDEIWLEGEQEDSLIGRWDLSSSNEQLGRVSGMFSSNPKSLLRIKLSSQAAQLSLALESGRDFSWLGDLHDQSLVSIEIPKSNFRYSSELQASYQAHCGQRMWVTTDDTHSFASESDLAFVKEGLVLWVPVFYWANNDWDDTRSAARLKKQLSDRITAIKATVRPMRLPSKL